MSEENRGFAVSDRRHFQSDGLVREEEPPSEGARHESPNRADSAAEDNAREGAGRTAVDFSHFLLSIVAQAGTLFQKRESSQDLKPTDAEDAARVISIIEMLQDKTDGRRTPEETKLLDQILFELRMAYVTVYGKGRA